MGLGLRFSVFLPMKIFPLLLVTFGLTLAARAADEPKAWLALPGKVLFESPLDRPLPSTWKAAKGDWKVVDGVLSGAELEADHHGAVIRLTGPVPDFVIEYEFQFAGARTTSLSINAVKDHMSRINITPKNVTIRRDDNDHEGPDKAIVFAVFAADFKPGTWHKVRMEMVGDTLLGGVDEMIAWGSDPLFATQKAAPGFTVGGESVRFRNLVIREATLNPEWEQVKATLPKPGEQMAPAPVGKGKGKAKGKGKGKGAKPAV
jgi:hypothetical protein